MVETQEFTFPSSDGVHQIWAQWWRPGEGTPRGVLQLVHGISEYIGRYDAFARTMARQGWAVVGHDHLGHGRTVRDPSIRIVQSGSQRTGTQRVCILFLSSSYHTCRCLSGHL